MIYTWTHDTHTLVDLIYTLGDVIHTHGDMKHIYKYGDMIHETHEIHTDTQTYIYRHLEM